MNRNRVVLAIGVLFIIALLASYSAPFLLVEQNSTYPPSTIHVIFHHHTPQEVLLSCEIADTPEKQTQGLMFREYLPEEYGMIFLYDTPQQVTFWMKNTYIPLDIIFINASGFVTSYASADVQLNASDQDLIRYASGIPIQYVVETNQGFCEKYAIQAGTPVTISSVEQ